MKEKEFFLLEYNNSLNLIKILDIFWMQFILYLKKFLIRNQENGFPVKLKKDSPMLSIPTVRMLIFSDKTVKIQFIYSL
jgi:hypothetical protein